MRVQSPSWADPLEKGVATHSSNFCQENPLHRGAWQSRKESETTEST